jgi:hypothetical protein
VRAVQNRDLIGQAKGILMEREGCSADSAFRMLVEMSQRTNTKVVDIAAQISDSVGSHADTREHWHRRTNRLPSARATGTSSDENRDEHQRFRTADNDSA